MSNPELLREEECFRNNPGQLAAFKSKGNCVVLAGPGSGKTRVLAAKVAALAHQLEDKGAGVACITYSNECRIELQKRLNPFGLRETKNVFVGTVHGYCLRHIIIPFAENVGIPIPSPLSVASDAQRLECGQAAVDLTISSDDRWWGNWDNQVERFRKRKNASTEGIEDRSPLVAAEYLRQLRSRGLIDFDDIVILAEQIIRENSWTRDVIKAKHPVIAIDEYQDLGISLHGIVCTLLESGVRFFVVGDPDQCIYEELQEARPELLTQLTKRPDVETVSLKFNYRSGDTLIRAAVAVLGVDKGYLAKNSDKGRVHHHPISASSNKWDGRSVSHASYAVDKIIAPEIARGRSPGQIGVLVLNKNIAGAVADSLSRKSIRSVRLDRGLPFERTPLVMWIAEAVRWCSIGQQCLDPLLADLKRDWLALDRTGKTSDAAWEVVVRFLFDHMDPNVLLRQWLADFCEVVLSSSAGTNLISRDLESLAELRTAAEPNAMHGVTTTGVFTLKRGSPEHVTIVTLHSAKGLEFPIVVMPMMDDGVIPHFKLTVTPSQHREQRRLFYVGFTRASSDVHLITSREHGPSYYVKQILSSLE